MVHLVLHAAGQLTLLIVLSSAACGFGATLLSVLRVRSAQFLEHYLFAQTLGFGCLSAVMMGLGALALYYPITAWIVVGLGLLLLGYHGRRLALLRLPRLAWHATDSAVVLAGTGAIILLALSYSLWANALVPPVSYDVVAYHFAIPKLYAAAHRIVYIPYIVYSNWPLGTEMLYTLGLLLGSEFLPQLITWAFAVLILLSLFCLARGRLTPRAGSWSAAILFSTPMMATVAGTGLVEIPLTAYTCLAFYAYWRWVEERTANWLVVAALVGGLAATTKLNGAAIALVLGALVLLAGLRAQKWVSTLQDFVIYGLVSFLVVLPWYVKTWVYTGNPLWPFLQPLFGGRDWDTLGTEYLVGYLHTTNLPATAQNWLLGLWFVTQSPGKFGSFQIGPYLLALMPLAIFPAVFERQARPLLANLSIVAVALYSVWFALTHQTRFLLPTTPIMALIAGAGVAWLGQIQFKPVGLALSWLVIIWLLSGVWVFNPSRSSDWQRRLPYLRGVVNRSDFLTSIYADYPVFQYANATLRPSACILLVPYDVRGYYLDRSYVWGNIISQRFVRFEQFSNETALANKLRDIGVTHVWLNTDYVLSGVRYGDYDTQLINALLARDGNLLSAAGSTQLFELRSMSGSKSVTGGCGS